MQNNLFILTGNQRIHPGLSGPRDPRGDLFYHVLTREENKVTFSAESFPGGRAKFDMQAIIHMVVNGSSADGLQIQ